MLGLSGSEHSLSKAVTFGGRLLGVYLSTPLTSYVILLQLLETQFPYLEIGDKSTGRVVRVEDEVL